MLVLDTDVLSIVQRATGEEYERLVSRLDAAPRQPVYVTIVSFEEQMRGWLARIAAAKSLDRQIVGYAKLRVLLEDSQSRPILGFDEQAAAVFRRLQRERIRIGTMDLKIAAITLAHEAKLISRNLADFRKIPGLAVEDWAA